jgi:hypothetical protein
VKVEHSPPAPQLETARPAAGIWESLVDATFMIDIYCNFRTAHIINSGGDILITSRRQIARRYLLGFFFVDFVSTIPWDQVLRNDAIGFVRLFKAGRLMKLSRAIRILKIFRILRLLKVHSCIPRMRVAWNCTHALLQHPTHSPLSCAAAHCFDATHDSDQVAVGFPTT